MRAKLILTRKVLLHQRRVGEQAGQTATEIAKGREAILHSVPGIVEANLMFLLIKLVSTCGSAR